jgi:hypothetical protein
VRSFAYAVQSPREAKPVHAALARMQTCDSVASPSGCGWLDQVYPMYTSVQLQAEAVIGIWGSTNHRISGLTIFRRV